MQKRGAFGKDNKVLVIGLLIVFVIALLVLNFGKFTGSVTKESPTTVVTITPDKLNAGEYLNINLIPGKDGAYREYHICSAYNDACIARPRFFCNQFRCEEPVTTKYKSWAGWEPGVYYVKVFDYGAKNYARAYFTIE
ncbi:hypothetical protein J4231_00355 [Candidatus Woesearchaeota archaeon]|nr:hypothetical protein [Candidatus Woesearchaeota archaeon]